MKGDIIWKKFLVYIEAEFFLFLSKTFSGMKLCTRSVKMLWHKDLHLHPLLSHNKLWKYCFFSCLDSRWLFERNFPFFSIFLYFRFIFLEQPWKWEWNYVPTFSQGTSMLAAGDKWRPVSHKSCPPRLTLPAEEICS